MVKGPVPQNVIKGGLGVDTFYFIFLFFMFIGINN